MKKFLKSSIFIRLLGWILFSAFFIQEFDIIGPSDFVYRHLNITSNTVIFSILLLTALLRFFIKKELFSTRVSQMLLLLFGISFISSLVMTIVDQLTYTNFVYSHIRINYDKVGFLSFAFLLMWVINQPNIFFKKHKKQLLLALPFVISVMFLMMYFWPFDVLKKSLAEDGPIESLQFFFPFVACCFSLLIVRDMFRKRMMGFAILYLVLAVGLFFVSGEEISWGQRIFQIHTPEQMMEINRQKEISVHNITVVERGFLTVEILANIVGALGLAITLFLARTIDKKYLFLLLPRGYYFFFFVPTIVYYLTNMNTVIPYIPEVVEFYFYVGITLFIIENYRENPFKLPQR